jgi:hypothetical protein
MQIIDGFSYSDFKNLGFLECNKILKYAIKVIESKKKQNVGY